MAENTKMDVDGDETLEVERQSSEDEGEPDEEGSVDLEDNEKTVDPRIQQLELQVASNPYHYDSHAELIKLLRNSGDLDRVRDARESMSKIFPLTEELWLEWIQDEIPLACIPEQNKNIIALFERAVQDYQSVRLWIQYCQFLMDNMEGQDGIEGVRSVFEKSLTAAGLHVTEGASIWDGYRDFEMAILDSFEQMAIDDDSDVLEEKIAAQRERVKSLFRRQVTIPLLGMQTTFKDFEAWLEEPVPDSVTQIYEKAVAKMEECLPFEDALASAESPKLAEFKSYLEYELKKDDPARIQCLYERALKANCLVGDLWNEYASYLDFKLKIPSVVLPVYVRATRNCVWVSLLWQNYLRALERAKQGHSKVKETLDKAMTCGFSSAEDYLQLWHCYCDYMRRRVQDWTEESQDVKELRETFKNAMEYLQNYFGPSGDPTSLLGRYWSRIEAFHIRNMAEAQRLWESVMSSHGREVEFWLEYANLMRSCRDIKLCRKVLQRAVQSASDNPEMAVQALLSFEREEGMLEDWDAAFSRCRVQLLRVNERRAKVAEKEAGQAKEEELKVQKRKENKSEKRAEKRAQKKAQKSEQLGREAKKPVKTGSKKPDQLERAAKKTDQLERTAKKPDPVERKAKEPDQLESKGTKQDQLEMNPLKRKAPVESKEVKQEESAEESSEPAPKKQHEDSSLKTEDSQAAESPTEAKHDSTTNVRTVFLSNLLYSVDEERLRERFSQLGTVTAVRLVKNKMGHSKGYAYIEFENESAVQAALAMDREKLDGRPMFVSQCVDKAKNPTTFKYPTVVDKNTLFVANIPFDMQQAALEELFSPHGKIKDVRIVTTRGGKAKGYAYVEFEDEIVAAKALLALDGSLVGERTISVAISNPPSRRPREAMQTEPARPQLGSRGRARTQLQLLPRALQKPAPTSSSPTPLSTSTAPPDEEEKGAKTEAKKGFSNDYFRSLMQKKS